MDFGVVLQCNPPAPRLIALAQKAEQNGFARFWTYDSHVLWQEPYVLYSKILDSTFRISVGPMVTNPATRDWTVTASHFATLNALYGNRTICGIGRGDSAVRVTNGKPTTVKDLRDAVHVIRELANSRGVEINGSEIRFPWSVGSELDVWVAAYGPLALKAAGEVGDGYILQCGDPAIAKWMIATVRAAAEAAGRDPESIAICVAAPIYITDGTAEARDHARTQCRWFGGMVGNHVADIVAKYGTDSDVPHELTDYLAGRQGYDYNTHGSTDNDHVDFVPDEIVDRFCVIGTPHEITTQLAELKALGVDHFAGYLDHDNKDRTLEAFGATVIPALADRTRARS